MVRGICTCAARRIGAPLSLQVYCRTVQFCTDWSKKAAKATARKREKKKKDREIRTSSSKRTGAFCTKLYYYTRVYIILGKAALESCTNSLLQGASDFSRNTLWQNLKIYSMLNGSGAVHVIAYIVNMNKIIDGAVTHDFNIFTCIISINSIKMVYY